MSDTVHMHLITNIYHNRQKSYFQTSRDENSLGIVVRNFRSNWMPFFSQRSVAME